MTNQMPTIEVDAETLVEVCDMANAWLEHCWEQGHDPIDQPEYFNDEVEDALGMCEQTDELLTKVAEETDLMDE